ncbi:hypothetical protein BH23BAC4_BH23BAC4_10760 [soil metagenome]
MKRPVTEGLSYGGVLTRLVAVGVLLGYVRLWHSGVIKGHCVV